MLIKKPIYIESPSEVHYRSHGMSLDPQNETLLFDRFGRIDGANQQSLTNAKVVLIGCGGLNGEVGHGLIRKGVGHVSLFDYDTVEITNFPRQHFFLEDLGEAKAKALARNLLRQATASSQIDGYVTSFQDAMSANLPIDGDVVVVGVDNNATRIAAAEYYHDKGIPVVCLAVDVQATRGYVFVQTSQPGDPCFQCLFPDAATDQRIFGCAGASIEILKTMAGVALYAIDSLLMDRPRQWNYKAIFLDQGGDGVRMIGQRENCPLCSSSNKVPPR